MKRFIECLKSARRIEIFLALAAVAVLMLQGMNAMEGSSGTDLEARLERILSEIDGVGEVRAMVSVDNEGQPEGALIVAEGAEHAGTLLRLQYSVSTLLGLEITRIEVAPFGG